MIREITGSSTQKELKVTTVNAGIFLLRGRAWREDRQSLLSATGEEVQEQDPNSHLENSVNK